MTAQEIRRKYIEFFKSKNHKSIKRASLVPKDDGTTLFTGSGMQPIIPFLLGKEHPSGVRLVNSQTCIRAQDIDEVGDNRHTTFFEMLGNWSLGDYGKKEQISWFFEFLVDIVGLDPNKIYVSCFIGSKKYGIDRDNESAHIWQELFKTKNIEAKIVEIGSAKEGDQKGMQGGRIFFYDDGENWWSRNGGLDTTPIGDPCGPDSEVFYDFGEEYHDKNYGEAHPASDSGRFMEIGNQVFMQYQRTDEAFVPLLKPNVDFGGGLERITAASINSADVFKISLLWPIIQKIEQLSGKNYGENLESMRVIADHLRGAVFLAVDGVVPSNKEHGYVMRRLIRRAMVKAHDLGIEQNFLQETVPIIADLYHEDYPEIAEKRGKIIETLVKEERAFRQTLRKGLREFEKMAYANPLTETFVINGKTIKNDRYSEKIYLNGENIFKLYDTYGFPVELSKEEALTRNIKISDDADKVFEQLMREQRERSQTAAKGAFKGGLVDHEPDTIKHHTATHLLYAALRQVLGDSVVQRGSKVTSEKTRFDFSYQEKLTEEQKIQLEKIVNEQIQKDLKVSFKEYPTEEAFKIGAKGAFGDKYADTVKVYKMCEPNEKPFSIEICGGPHVEHTGQLAEGNKKFKITKEKSSSAGIRRIEASLLD